MRNVRQRMTALAAGVLALGSLGFGGTPALADATPPVVEILPPEDLDPLIDLAADVLPGGRDSDPTELVTLHDTLYFVATTAGNGRQVNSYHNGLGGGPGTTRTITDLVLPHELTVMGGLLYFFASDDDDDRYDLWAYQPATDTLRMVADVVTPFFPANPQQLTAVAGKLYFVARSGFEDYVLLEFDPARATRPDALRVINTVPSPVEQGTYVGLLELDGKLYIQDDGSTILQVYDPATDELSVAEDFSDEDPGTSLSFRGLLGAVDSQLYLAVDAPDTGTELWVYDSTLGDASLAADVQPGYRGSQPQDVVGVDGKVYFVATRPRLTGREVFEYDPAAGTVKLVADIGNNSGGGGTVQNSAPRSLMAAAGRLFFAAQRTATTAYLSDHELWMYDPAANGGAGAASLVQESRHGPEESAGRSDVDDLAEYAGGVYFSARGAGVGAELFAYHPQRYEVAVLPVADAAATADGLPVTVYLRNNANVPLTGRLRLAVTSPDGTTTSRDMDGFVVVGADGVLTSPLILPVGSAATPGEYEAFLRLLDEQGRPLAYDGVRFTVTAIGSASGP